MIEERTIHLVEIPLGGKEGLVWNRLHGEREAICEGLLQEQTESRRAFLQKRLRKLDDALDRLMSGSYGNCCQCGRAIEDAKLEIDPALALCRNCRKPAAIGATEQSNLVEILLESLNPFDTILMRTHNSDYRILLLDPNTGRALIEGGEYLVEPNEALLTGSAIPGSEFKAGTLSLGSRLEILVDERVLLTSPIKALRVKHNSAAEPVGDVSATLH
jgi:hypothetical protein